MALCCALFIVAGSAPGAAPAAAELAKSMQEQWKRCLANSFQTYEARTPSKNSAADMALQFCSTQEDAFWADAADAGMSRNAFEQLKAATKKGLIGGK